MIFNNIDKETKLEILQENLTHYEKDIYQNLIKLGIDPEEFDLNTFDRQSLDIDEQNASAVFTADLLDKDIKALNMIYKEIDSLGS